MNLLIVSPDPEKRVACADALRNYGFRIDKEPGIEEALAGVERRASDRMRADLIVLAGMAAGDCLEGIFKLGAHPILSGARLLAVCEGIGPDETALLLDGGADDVYSRPFVSAIYSARVRGLLRRPKAGPRAEDPAQVLRLGLGLKIYTLDRRVLLDGKLVELSRGRFDLLEHLARHSGNTCPQARLRQVLSKTLLYAAPERLRAELEQLRASLGRYADRLVVGPDGSACLRGESSETAAGASAEDGPAS